MTPADLIGWFFLSFVVAPVGAAVLSFRGPASIRPLARAGLLFAALANMAAAAACCWYAFARPSSGIGNQVLLLVAIPIAVLAVVWFAFWRAARRHAYAVQA
jgi:hypothetical protein